MPTGHDIAIRWNDEKLSTNQLKLIVGVPLHCFPHHFKGPGGWVAIVDRDNAIRLLFKAKTIEGPRNVRRIDGKNQPNGYWIRADKQTMRQPQPPIQAPIKGWHAIGAFRYIDATKMKAKLVGPIERPSRHYIESSKDRQEGIVFRQHIQGIPGIPYNRPEAKLVDQYVLWMGSDAHFGHNYIREVKLFVDLFDRTHWQLIEAKATTNREAIRMAIGQLRDYKRSITCVILRLLCCSLDAHQ